MPPFLCLTPFVPQNKYLECGALSVYALLSHLALNNETIVQKLIDSRIVKILATNSHPMSQVPAVASSGKFVILDVSPVFVRTIQDHLLTE